MEVAVNQNNARCLVPGCRAPEFRALTNKGTFYFPCEFSGNWVVLYGHHTISSDSEVSGKISLVRMENGFEPLIISDPTLEISRKYGLLDSNGDTANQYVTVCVIDPNAIIRALVNHPFTMEYDMEFFKQLIISLEKTSLDSTVEVLSLNATSAKIDQSCDCFFCTSA